MVVIKLKNQRGATSDIIEKEKLSFSLSRELSFSLYVECSLKIRTHSAFEIREQQYVKDTDKPIVE